MKKRLLFLSANVMFLFTFLMPVAFAGATPIVVHGGPRIRVRQGTSSNWSGYAAYGAAGSFNSVSANWVQPAVVCTTQNTYSSYWVGLDGYNTNTVEQLGTEADCSRGRASYYVWYEMYPRAGYYISIPVAAGNQFSASVTYASRNSYKLSITNQTAHKSFSTTQTLATAQRASAEAIVEAPYSRGILPLADYGTASFTSVLANGNPISKYVVDPITMDNPYGMKSTPSALTSGENFTMTWSAS